MASIQAERLVKRYNPGAPPAVSGIDFEIADGEFVAILGPSGCGKSSTMRMIAGLETITEGTIRFDGRPVNEVRARERNVAMSFESYALYPTISVYENIAFPLRCRGEANAAIDRQVRQIAETMELAPLLQRRTKELSSGQAQRVGLARALIRRPTVFLLDEPISHLDTRQRYRMRQFIKSIHRDFKTTMIYVTHDQEEAMALADRIIVMSHGDIQQIGTPEEIYERPVNAFVAGFVGEPPINFIDGEVVVTDGEFHFTTAGQSFLLPPKVKATPGRMRLAVRPAWLSLGSERDHHLRATHFVTERLQDHNILVVDVGRTRVTLLTDPAVLPRDGEKLYLRLDPDRILLYPPDGSQAAADDDDS
ncbi:ABC transporter ATP-binding protein [Geminicoccus harenae]|uniref:ABC transporter ATP-binding protein n=1 Tax=Geminicoccus harenae TaxID=2498453 RepID=UPI00168ADB75|nr:ABC transporter ATP-binding protein [Geminicoccus harenae]